jgi:hypothetical protein
MVDTLEFFPHNYEMPQLSSTNRLLMTAKAMTDAFQNPYPEVPFASVGDDTVKALADLASIFKLKLQQATSDVTQASPATTIQRPNLIPFPTRISTSPMPKKRQTRSQTTIHTPDIPYRPLPPRVVTPQTLYQSPPRVPSGSQEFTPRNLSQDDFVQWTHPIWRFPSDITIGHNGTMPTQSFTQSPAKKWNTRLS